MKRTLLAVLAALALLVPSALSASKSPKVLDSVRPLFGEVEVSDMFTGETTIEVHKICSTSSINQAKHYWLTAGHCIWDKDGSDTPTTHPRWISGKLAKVVKLSGEFDLAVLEVDDLSVPALKMQPYAPAWGENIRVVGFPFDWTIPTVFKGFVANPSIKFDADKPYMLFDMAAAPGNSGSAVVNDKDEVVSVLQIGWGRSFSPVSGGATFDQMVKVVWPYFEK